MQARKRETDSLDRSRQTNEKKDDRQASHTTGGWIPSRRMKAAISLVRDWDQP